MSKQEDIPNWKLVQTKSHPSSTEPIDPATSREREQLLEQFPRLVFPSSIGLSGEKTVHLPERPEAEDRDDTEVLCTRLNQSSNVTRKPATTYPTDTLSFCRHCVRRWRDDDG